MLDKGMILVAMLFCFMPVIAFSFFISWAMDPDKEEKQKEEDGGYIKIYTLYKDRPENK